MGIFANPAGYRTLIFGLTYVIGGLATMLGVTIDPETLKNFGDSLNAVIGGGISATGLGIIIFRMITKSPILKKPE